MNSNNKTKILSVLLISCALLGFGYMVSNAISNDGTPQQTNNQQQQSNGQDVFYPVAYNLQIFEGINKIAGNGYAFDKQYQYPDTEIASGNYLATVSYTGGASQELITKAALDAFKVVNRFNGTSFWVYTKPTGYVGKWTEVQVVRNKYATTEDEEVGVSVVKAGSIVESGSTSTTESATAPAWTTTLMSTYTTPVVMRFVDSNASNSEISTIAVTIDGINQSVNKVSGGWYANVTINGNRTIKVTATRKTAADLNASVVTYVNELNPSGATDFFNYGTQLFTETNTD